MIVLKICNPGILFKLFKICKNLQIYSVLCIKVYSFELSSHHQKINVLNLRALSDSVEVYVNI